MPHITHNTSNGPIEFGPVFHKQFLREVLYLQGNITQINANGTMLHNICYAPLKDANSVVNETDCVVQSIWGYFQDLEERLDETEEENGFNVSKEDL